MKLMRIVRNMNAISTFMRNAGIRKPVIAFVNYAIMWLILVGVIGFILMGLYGN